MLAEAPHDRARIALWAIVAPGFLMALGCGGAGSSTKSASPAKRPTTAPAADVEVTSSAAEDDAIDAPTAEHAPTSPAANAPQTIKPKGDLSRHGDKYDAIDTAQRTISNILKYPDDASFGWKSDASLSREYEGRRYWTVNGTVKAPNDFGASLTHRYEVSLRLDQEKQTWNVAYVVFDRERIYHDQDETSWVKWTKQHEADAVMAEYQASERREAQAEVAAERKRAAKRAAEKEKQKADELEASYRTWSDADGNAIGEARFAGAVGKKIKLKSRDGSTIETTLDALSADDQEFIQAKRK